MTEAQSYRQLCVDNDFWAIEEFENGSELKEFILEEGRALDSFQNILFSMLLFWKMFRSWPRGIAIISHTFKRPRFMELHVPALRWPRERVEYFGIDPPYLDSGNVVYDVERAEAVTKGELERGYDVWKEDALGLSLIHI